MRLSNTSVLLQADSIIIFRRFKVFVQLRDGKGGIRPKEPHQVSLCIAGDDGSQKRFPSIGTMDVAMAQDAALQMTKLVEDEERMITHAAEVPVPCGSFPVPRGSG